MPRSRFFVFLIALIVSLASVSIAFAFPGDADDVCFTLEPGPLCGKAATGPTIVCTDGTGGPSYLRIAPLTYTCKKTLSGETGKPMCDSTVATVEETHKVYECVLVENSDKKTTYALVSNDVLQTCPTAQLSGEPCTG